MHTRIRRVALAITAVAIVAIAGGVTYAVADIGGGGVINGCYKSQNGQLRLIDPATDSCHPSEKPISWSQTGPQGPPGHRDPQVRQGPAGAQGPAGPDGTRWTDGPEGRHRRDRAAGASRTERAASDQPLHADADREGRDPHLPGHERDYARQLFRGNEAERIGRPPRERGGGCDLQRRHRSRVLHGVRVGPRRRPLLHLERVELGSGLALRSTHG